MELLKFALFLAMEVFVVAALLGALLLGLVQIVRDAKMDKPPRTEEAVGLEMLSARGVRRS